MNFDFRAILHSPKFRKTIKLSAAFLVLLLIVFFSFRNMVLHRIINSRIETFNKKYPAKLIIDDATFSGFTGIRLSGVKIIPDKKDTLFVSGSVCARLRFFPMLVGKARIADLELTDTKVRIVKKNKTDNYSFLLSEKPVGEKAELNYSDRIDRISDAVFETIPEEFSLTNFSLSATLDSNNVKITVKELQFAGRAFKAPVLIEEGKKKETVIAEGSINKRRRTASLKLYADKGKFTLPVAKKRWGLLLSFDTLKIGVLENKYNDEKFVLNGYAGVYGLIVNHRRISVNDVKMDVASFDYNFNIGKDYIELDSASSVTYNNLMLNLYLLYKKDDSKQVTFKMNNEFSAQDFFTSLPSGLFTTFDGIKTEGKLALKVNLFVDSGQPDSLKFDGSLTGKDFKVLKYGETDFTIINAPFTYTAYENGEPAKSFVVGDENPEFTPLDDISVCLKEAVLISENGGYYFSSGFDIGSLRLALIDNIKQKRFARGGSTIEMQLVRNVFLSKKKTIARKFEELIIVWLMQAGNLCNKDRMYEVYLNIAEWGPGIYGISEASDYYFRKRPASLSLPESIFLASILPKPKWFKYSFDSTGTLNAEQNQAYFSNIAGIMLEKAIIAQSDTNDLLQRVKIKGDARLYMARDTVRFNRDSLMMFYDRIAP